MPQPVPRPSSRPPRFFPPVLATRVRAVARVAACGLALGLAACAAPSAPPPASAAVPDLAELQRQVADTERAFARTMAERDHAGFARFLADEAVFFSGAEALRGKAAVAAYWKRFYEAPQAPFSWHPDRVQVLDSGTLASSSGPVLDPAGRPVGRFNSIWRLEAPGTWRIVFDSGCNCP